MEVLIVEPNKAPRMANIGEDLKSLQEIVGGYIEVIYPYEDLVALICNEEGKIMGLPLNRKLEDYDIIAGTFIICGLSEDNFGSLSSDLAAKYQEKFAHPEVFMMADGKIIAIPIPVD